MGKGPEVGDGVGGGGFVATGLALVFGAQGCPLARPSHI